MRFLFFFIFTSFQFSFAQHNLQGFWQGKLKVEQDSIRLVFQFKDSKIYLISPDQGSPTIESEINWNQDSVMIKNKNLFASFIGIFQKSDSTLQGYWAQGGGKRKLTLVKVSKIEPRKRAQNPVDVNYQVREVKYKNKNSGFHLSGTLTLPQGNGPFPAVLLISGSGPQDRNEPIAGHYPFWVIADFLTKNGIAVLRYDDRGIGESEGAFDQANIYEFFSDAQAGIEFLNTCKEVNPLKIGVIGHSEGGWIAEMLSTLEKQKISFAVGLAGPGISGDSVMRLQGALVLKSMGIQDSTIRKYKVIQGKLLDLAISQTDSAEAMNKAGMFLEGFLSQLSPQEQIKIGMTEKGIMTYAETLLSPWFRIFLRFNPEPYLKKIKIPFLAINGEKDIQVPAKENLQAIKKLIPKGLATIKAYKNMNHLFQTCQTCTFSEYNKLEETISPIVLNDILKWIQKQTK